MRNPLVFLSTLLLLLILPTTLARQPPTSFCKCICFQNSTIIPLNSPPSQPKPAPPQQHTTSTSTTTDTFSTPVPINHRPTSTNPSNVLNTRNPADKDKDEDGNARKHHTLTCNDCNRAFCLDYNLAICKNAKEEDVFTSCFQRDSLKDETVVLLFVLLTTSLLAWAILKPYIDKFQSGAPLSAYAPVSLRSGREQRGGLPTTRSRSEGYTVEAENRGREYTPSRADGLDGGGGYSSRPGGSNT